MKILVIGSGGREHAIIRRLSQDSTPHELHAAPGNPGMAEHAALHAVNPHDHDAVIALATQHGIDLVVIGPEAPLVDGLADSLREAHFRVFGPSKAAAMLEGSKDFAKQVMHAAKVPTARSLTVTDPEELETALDQINPGGHAPYVVKADGLAAGKGVVVTLNRDEALVHARACLAKPEGRVVLEEYLDGPELSVFCICDGERAIPLVPAQDFKRAYKGDEGPNTGGMGAYTPLPWLDEQAAMRTVMETIAEPTLRHMREAGTPFIGTLFVGLAATKNGLKVIEFNARFGDPETQVVLDRLDSDLGELLYAAAVGHLDTLQPPRWKNQAGVIVVLASEGYPATSRTGDVISGLADATDPTLFEGEPPHVIHAGTALKGKADGVVVANGGRVLGVVACAPTLEEARVKAQAGIARITLPGSHYRTDIAEKAALGQIEQVRL